MIPANEGQAQRVMPRHDLREMPMGGGAPPHAFGVGGPAPPRGADANVEQRALPASTVGLSADRTHRHFSFQGFTLIELVVVLFLLSLATGLVLPAVGRGMEALELRAQVAGFAAFLRYGREQAITRRTSHEVRVDPETRELALIARGSESPKVRKQLSSRIQISAESPTAQGVIFSPHGFSSGARFRLEGPGGRVYRVTVDPLTGRVSSLREG